MSETSKTSDVTEEKKTITLKTLQLRKAVERDQVKQNFTHGRSKTVEVEVKRKRIPVADKESDLAVVVSSQDEVLTFVGDESVKQRKLTKDELGVRMKAVQDAIKKSQTDEEKETQIVEDTQVDQDHPELSVDEALAQPQKNSFEVITEEKSVSHSDEIEKRVSVRQLPKKRPTITADSITPIILRADGYIRKKPAVSPPSGGNTPKPLSVPSSDDPAFVVEKAVKPQHPGKLTRNTNNNTDERGLVGIKADKKKVATSLKDDEPVRKLNRGAITKALDENYEGRTRSVAALKRARQKQKNQSHGDDEIIKVVREVIIPETIAVSELANRMAIRAADVVKSLMKIGVMATINQVIDADTAELLCDEYGHKFKRISDADIEIGLKAGEDNPSNLLPRAPIVTVMGHVDHGKTSLLDALRKTDIAGGEAGGITQHIGAYQVTLRSGQKITFIDTPGHAAFSEMRARGANVTDIVVLVVAADDGIMEQTKEAINHAKAAGVPIVVAINKIDKPDANPERVRHELLSQGILLEEFGGDVLSVEVSAKQGKNLEKLEEAILLQAEILDLKANPNRPAEGVIVEAKMEKGRGTVATALIQHGTLNVGDIVVAGTEWGRVRALVNDHGQRCAKAMPAMPIEIQGFDGVPEAGNELVVVDSENRAREVTEYRQQRQRNVKSVASAKTAMENIMDRIGASDVRELPVIIKADVQGSLEAIISSLAKLTTDEVRVKVLHGAVGGVNESDVTLARASGGMIVGFNVRANPQARDIAKRDGIEIRYYSIIYNVIDDAKALLGGLLAPTLQEKFLGTVEIREVFSVSKTGKIAGCYVTDGIVKRGSKVRLLRDNVVIYQGDLKSLRRFKDEVREVKESYECGIALENYNDIRQGDVIECYEIESIARQL